MPQSNIKLLDVLPKEFFDEHMDSKASKHLDVTITKNYINKP